MQSTVCKRACIGEVTNYLFCVYLQIQMFINSQTKEFYICLYSIFYLYRKLEMDHLGNSLN